MAESKVFWFDESDPEMRAACKKARETFRYFWRELAWERRRIVPGLDLAAVKAPFADGDDVEQMWLSEIDFDGKRIHGVLLNEPNALTNVKAGDSADFALNEISDWMYAIQGQVYGAFTVNLIRSRMSSRERKEHDTAWGLDFGDPHKIRLVPEKKTGWFSGWFKTAPDPATQEHPMSENMGPAFDQQLRDHPEMLNQKDDRGWTFLHQQALAGSVATVKVLLAHGADRDAETDDGMTALQLAKSLGWDRVVALLKE